ncbi:MAG: recombinase family protein [Candidatus Saccharibacteria bacterium]
MLTAAYARYSSDNQRDASLDDQLRNCRTYCERQGWPAPVVYTDAATSGARNDRTGYQRLLAEASRYAVVLVDDLSRLSRDSAECAMVVRRLKFGGVRLIGVSDGVDTARKSHKADVGLRGLMSELYLDDLAEKTHRGLTGRALQGANAGGLAYGYRVAGTGQRTIDEAQATVVRRIYADYVAGSSPRAIADALNRESVPSPRGGTWAMSAIYGDTTRGIGILANPIYIGRQVWNRSRWIKHPDTGRRIRQNRPESEWITTEHPELAIIDAETWARTQDRIRGAKPRRTGQPHAGPGRPPRYLLSGILRCAECGGAIVMVGRHYGCSVHKDRGDAVCSSRVRVAPRVVEHALLATIREELLTDAAFQRLQRAVSAALKRAQPDTDAMQRRLANADRVKDNILAALRAGIITPSTRAELLDAESAVASAQAELVAARAQQPAQVIPRLRERWRAIVADLGNVARNIPAARAAIRELLGDRITLARNENGDLFAEIAASNINLVAGACSVLYLTEPLRIPLQSASDGE